MVVCMWLCVWLYVCCVCGCVWLCVGVLVYGCVYVVVCVAVCVRPGNSAPLCAVSVSEPFGEDEGAPRTRDVRLCYLSCPGPTGLANAATCWPGCYCPHTGLQPRCGLRTQESRFIHVPP